MKNFDTLEREEFYKELSGIVVRIVTVKINPLDPIGRIYVGDNGMWYNPDGTVLGVVGTEKDLIERVAVTSYTTQPTESRPVSDLVELLKEVRRFNKGEGKYNYSGLKDD